MIALLLAAPVRASTLFDPAFRFRTIRTPHFVIHFHQGEDRLASRLAVVAEEAWRALEQPLGVTPPPLTHVVIADQSERAGGYGHSVPYNTIVLDAAWPAGSDLIGNTRRLAAAGVQPTSSRTSRISIDRKLGARSVENVFGRVPLAFPNLYLPTWQIEGLATYEESALTGEGRLHDGDFRAIEAEGGAAARARAASIASTAASWTGPAVEAAYAYGAGFHQYLVGSIRSEAARGAGRSDGPACAAHRVARVPARSTEVARRVVERLSSRAVSTAVVPAPSDSGLVRLTHHRFYGRRPPVRSLRVRKRARRSSSLLGPDAALASRAESHSARRHWAAPPDDAHPRIDDGHRPRRDLLRSARICGAIPASTAISTSGRAPPGA